MGKHSSADWCLRPKMMNELLDSGTSPWRSMLLFNREKYLFRTSKLSGGKREFNCTNFILCRCLVFFKWIVCLFIYAGTAVCQQPGLLSWCLCKFQYGLCLFYSCSDRLWAEQLPPENVNKIWAVVSKAKISITPSTPTYELEGWGIPCQHPSWCLRFWPAKHPGTFLHWEILRSWEDWNTSVSSPVLTWLSSTIGFNT